MANIPIEQPPIEADPSMKEYLVRQLISINNGLGQNNYFSPRGTLPNKFKVGEVYYFKDAIALSDITGEGLWLYKTTGWVLIA